MESKQKTVNTNGTSSLKQERVAEVSILGATYERPGINSLLNPLGGMKGFVGEGDRVLLKVNLLSPREPGKAVTTHPEFVRAVIRAVKQAGGQPFIGDSPAGIFSDKSLRKAYRRSGLEALAEEEGIPLNFDTGARKLEVPNGRRLKRSPFCNYALEADKVIALPKLKTHSFQYMTLACKIMFGTVPGLTKAKYHAQFPTRTAFADMLLDILHVIKPVLIIMDGIMGMQGQGPNSGEPVWIGYVLASTDPVAMDIAVCGMISMEPMGIPILKRARLRNLWPERIDYPLCKPENIKVKEFRLPNTANRLGKKPAKKSPIVTDKCIACGACEKICPKHAITVIGETARVVYSKCIGCFCCHEVCPMDAIRLGVLKGCERGL